MKVFERSTLWNKKGAKVNASTALKDKVTMLYFSAHWCGPCRQFTPAVAKFYDNVKKSGAPFEVIFMSRDRDEETARKYFNDSHGDYLMLDYNDPQSETLAQKLKVSGIPTMLIIDNNGDMKVGREECMEVVMQGTRGKDISGTLNQFAQKLGLWIASNGTRLGGNTGQAAAEMSPEEVRSRRILAIKKRENRQKLKKEGFEDAEIEEALEKFDEDYKKALEFLKKKHGRD